MASDEALIGRVAEGEEDALRLLLARYERPLSAFIHRHTSGRDVEDLYQETWLRVVRYAARFAADKRFSTWMYQIAINLCRDWHRRHVADAAGMIDLPQPADTVGTEAKLDAQRLLAALPEAQREVLILRFYHDLTEDEVARILDCPKGTVKSRMHHALARLATVVRAEGR